MFFSHAGLTESFVSRHFDEGQVDLDFMIGKINQMGEAELWSYRTRIIEVIRWVRIRFEAHIKRQKIFMMMY